MSKYREIRSDYEENGEIYIDAWCTSNDNEEGRTIAKINVNTGKVTYLDVDARRDTYAQNVIKEVWDSVIKEVWDNVAQDMQKQYLQHGGHKFEVVYSIPHDYVIWNIGTNMLADWLPLCKLCQQQPFDGARNIEVDTLKAIYLPGAQIVLATHKTKISDITQYVKRYANSKNKDTQRKVQLCRQAIAVLRKGGLL